MLKFIAFYYQIITHPIILVIFVSLCGVLAIFLIDRLLYAGKPWYGNDDKPDL